MLASAATFTSGPAQATTSSDCTDGSTPALRSTVTCATPGTYVLTVPPGATQIPLTVTGAGGAGATSVGNYGGNGAVVTGTATLPPGTVSLRVVVGAGGVVNSATDGGGGSGVFALDANSNVLAGLIIAGAGGGGASGGSDSTYVRGGGDAGSGGANSIHVRGGAAGGADGTGGAGGYGAGSAGAAGASATQTSVVAGGAGGVSTTGRGGGGGGGYAGGGGGGGYDPGGIAVGGGGGGGSSFTNSTYVTGATTSLSSNRGASSASGGDGSVVLQVGVTTVPAAPTAVAASAGADSATVSFTAPADDGGSPITGYTVTSDPGAFTCSALPPSTSCVVTGLSSGVAYTFTAIATSDIGSSNPSGPSAPVTPLAPQHPPTVPNLPEFFPSYTSMRVFFHKPVDDGGLPILGYRISLNGGGTWSAPIRYTGPATGPYWATVGGLRPGTTYHVRMQAWNSAGYGGATLPPVTVTTKALPHPGPPWAPYAGPPTVPNLPEFFPSYTSMRVFFHKPVDDGGLPILGYRISLNGGGTWSAPIRYTGPATGPYWATVGGLRPGTTYQVRMQAWNGAGYGGATRPPIAVTTKALRTPTVPQAVTATATGTRGQLKLTWRAPADPGSSPILGYRVSLNGGYTWSGPLRTTGSYTAYVDGLPFRRAVAVRLQAWNGAGYGGALRPPIIVAPR